MLILTTPGTNVENVSELARSSTDLILPQRELDEVGGDRQHADREQQQQGAGVQRGAQCRGAAEPFAEVDDRGGERAHGLEEEGQPVPRPRGEEVRAGDHRDHDRLAQRPGGREHGGGDDRGAHSAQGDRADRAQPVDAERGGALTPGSGHRGEGVADERDHDWGDHQREQHHGHRQAGAGELNGALQRGPLGEGDEVVADERHQHEDPEQAPDDRGHGGEQAHDADHRGAQAGGGELDDEDRTEHRERQREQHGKRGDQQRAVDDRPGAHVVSGRGGVRGSGQHVFELHLQAAAGPEPGEAVVLEGGPRAHSDERDHKEHAEADKERHRAERTLGAVVGPGVSQTVEHGVGSPAGGHTRWRGRLRDPLRGGLTGTHWVEMILRAALLVLIHEMN